MTIAKMSMKSNSSRYFKISVNEYNQGCISGILYHSGMTPGICFKSFLEAVLYMNRIFDEMEFPKRSMAYRKFSGTDFPEPPKQKYYGEEEGKIATFGIYVKYRYGASWQGNITWLEGQERQEFESFLQMSCWIARILSGPCERKETSRASNICQIAVDSFQDGLLIGSVQNAFLNYLKEFTGIIALAEVIGDFAEIGCMKAEDITLQTEEIKIIQNDMFAAYREGGKECTFLIRILFRRNSTFQGVVYWREKGEKQAFRSFMELVLLMASALESRHERIPYDGSSYENSRYLQEMCI